MKKRLTRSIKEKKVAGVCGGLAEYFDIDPTLVRVAWIISSAFWGFGLITYIICAIVMPVDSELHDKISCEAKTLEHEQETSTKKPEEKEQ